MTKYCLLFTLCICTYCCAFSQNNQCDSLKKALDNYKKDDSVKVQMLYDYAYCQDDSNTAKSLQYLRTGIAISSRLGNNFMMVQGMYDASWFYNKQTHFDSSIYILLQALTILDKAGLKDYRISINNQLGRAYRMIDNMDKAEYYDNKSLEAAKAIKDTQMILQAFGSLIALAEDEKKWSKVDSMASQELLLAYSVNDSIHIAYIIAIQAEEFMALGQYAKAINNCRTAIAIWKNLKQPEMIAYEETVLSSAFTKSNIKDSALWYAKDALAITIPNHFDKETGDAHEALYNYYNYFGDYKNALSEKLIMDSVASAQNNITTAQNTTRAEMQYAQEKKDLLASIEKQKQDAAEKRKRNWEYAIIGCILLFAFVLLYNNRQKQKANVKIEKAYSELKSTQQQLIQSEKMASLGELTAGIAHEIQNPLNFVNNFSEVSRELIDELKSQKSKLKSEEQDEILNDIDANLEKINHHGKRADAIVKGMLQHSRSSVGVKELTDINALCDEYLRLSYHGLRAKDKSFNADIKTDFDISIGKINIVPQDIGRVLLNLFNNAFYAINEKSKVQGEKYNPVISVQTKKENNRVSIIVSDNGNGIPQNIIDKIFQPFFTTKPTGEGTGLGLSLSYDIIKAHGGEIKVETKEGVGSEFIIQLTML